MTAMKAPHRRCLQSTWTELGCTRSEVSPGCFHRVETEARIICQLRPTCCVSTKRRLSVIGLLKSTHKAIKGWKVSVGVSHCCLFLGCMRRCLAGALLN